MEWKNGEAGPVCFCGKATVVRVNIKQRPSLLCVRHLPRTGAFFPLPATRPDNWPNLSDTEMEKLIDKGFVEHNLVENQPIELEDPNQILN